MQLTNFKITAFSKLDGILQEVAFQRKQIFYMEVAIGENALNFKFIRIAKIDQAIFFSNTEYIKRKSGQENSILSGIKEVQSRVTDHRHE